ncbi:MAG: class I SAM-dependent methyltransferase [Actinobacteria bacterium]|nr:class I SAM-dependent methyltransferase [Actinomycetota bacterium]
MYLYGLIAAVLLILIYIAWSQIFGAPWIPTPYKTVHTMLEMARVKPGEVVYDLGSGDGRVIIEAARSFGARAVGIEIDPTRYLWTKLRILMLNLHDNVHVLFGNFFYKDLSQADVVTVYLLQGTNVRLMEKLENELRPGTRIVSNTFTFPGWKIIRQDSKAQIYVYRV